jgi:hypothetical protein
VQKAAICSNDKAVLSTSQTAVALGIKRGWDMSILSWWRGRFSSGPLRLLAKC